MVPGELSMKVWKANAHRRVPLLLRKARLKPGEDDLLPPHPTHSAHGLWPQDWALGCLGCSLRSGADSLTINRFLTLTVCPSVEIRKWAGPAPKNGGGAPHCSPGLPL